jgi:hypothetical protein
MWLPELKEEKKLFSFTTCAFFPHEISGCKTVLHFDVVDWKNKMVRYVNFSHFMQVIDYYVQEEGKKKTRWL